MNNANNAATLDHIGLQVSDFARAKDFYSAALQPLGIKLQMEFPSPAGGVAGFGRCKPEFWIAAGNSRRAHSISRSTRSTGLRSMRSTKLPLRPVRKITERQGCARSTTPITTAPSSSIPMGTISRRSAIILSEKQ